MALAHRGCLSIEQAWLRLWPFGHGLSCWKPHASGHIGSKGALYTQHN